MHPPAREENRSHVFCLCQAAALGLLLGACTARVLPLTPATNLNADGSAAANNATAHLVIHIKIPKSKPDLLERRPAYVSASTKGMMIAFRGPSKLKETFDLNVAASHLPAGCKRTARGFECTEDVSLKPCSSKANCYKGAIATFDSVSCKHSTCSIPAGAHELSVNQDIGFSVGSGVSALRFVLDGVPASVALQPSTSSALVENSPNSFAISKCITTPQTVSVVGVDADGNDIVGAGAPTSPKLKSNDATHLGVAGPAPGSNTFELVPASSLQSATIPNAWTVVPLTASVKPLKHSGVLQPVNSQSDVTFNGDVCGVISEYPVPTSSSQPAGIAAGPDGALWFSERGGNKIGRITTDGTITETAVPTGGSQPLGIAEGPDQAMWFAESSGNQIGRITTGGSISETMIPTAGSNPFAIAAGSDNALWFTESGANKIGRISTSGMITETNIPANVSAQGIAAGSDGAMWFVECKGNEIGRITTSGTITNQYPIPTASSSPIGIGAGPDGALWFTEGAGNNVGRLATDGSIREMAIPTAESVPFGIVAGPDAALWFTELNGNSIGRITTGGSISNSYAVPTSASEPQGIALGPDGALWFTECRGNNIGRLQ